MPGLTPRVAIPLHVPGQLGRGHTAKPDENRQAHAAHVRKRLSGRRGHPHRRMRLLIWARRDDRVLEAIELALVAEGLALPRLQDDLERLEEARLALLVWHAERVVGARTAATADPEVESTVAQVIQRRDLAGHAERMVQRQELHRRSDAQPLRPGDDPA